MGTTFLQVTLLIRLKDTADKFRTEDAFLLSLIVGEPSVS
jgi:hypothetical protein